MPVPSAESRVGHRIRTFPVAWPAVGALALSAALADGFWATALRGAVGATGPAQHPFGRWWRDALLVTPLHAMALVAVLVLVGRLVRCRAWSAQSRSLLTAIGTIIGFTVIGVAVIAVRAMTDVRTQRAEIALRHALHGVALPLGDGAGRCDAACSALRLTAAAHRTGVSQSIPLVFATNAAVVAVVLGLVGGLWRGGIARQPLDGHAAWPVVVRVGGRR